MKVHSAIYLMLLSLCACTKEEVVEPQIINKAFPQILINEFLASNQVYTDEAGEYDDWIEIYNSGNTPVDIAGLFISDDKNNPTKYKIPSTDPSKTTIEPKGYLLLWADSQMKQGILHVDFKLSADGEDIGIYDQDGKPIDEVSFKAQTSNVSSGRLLNGEWTTFSSPTPGMPNQ